MRLDLAFLLLLSFVLHGMYGTPQIKLPTKSSLQTRARNLKKNYCVPTEDVKLLRRNLRACLQEVTSSFRLFKLARSALQIMKYFSHRHKLQRFEAGLNGAACFKIFQVKLNPIFQVPDVLTEFRTESLVWVSERRLMVRVSGLKRVLSKASVLRCYCGLVDHG